MKAVYTDDIVFYESIIELIAKLQEQWPLEFRFELTRPRISGQPPLATGMDIAATANGKIRSLHLFPDIAENQSE